MHLASLVPADRALLREVDEAATVEQGATGRLVVLIARVDERRLYLALGYPSLRAFCIERLHLSEDAAYKRIQVARAGREFPAIFEALNEGRIHLAGLCLLIPHLTAGNVASLLEASTHMSKAKIEHMLAVRFPSSELLPLVEVIPSSCQLAPGQVEVQPSTPIAKGAPPTMPVARTTPQPAPAAPQSTVKPIAPQRFALHVSVDQATHDALRRAQDLLGHQVAPGDIAQVIGLALGVFVAQLEKQKCAATAKPRKNPPPTTTVRGIPRHVRRAVWKRDGGQCTYVSEDGRRCTCRRALELDHIIAIALGGESTVDNLRLRCHGHNQLAAERTFGREFMARKREQARLSAASA
jgi:Domain of unknown function (DUF222)